MRVAKDPVANLFPGLLADQSKGVAATAFALNPGTMPWMRRFLESGRKMCSNNDVLVGL